MFEPNTEYTAFITLTAEPGYTFLGVPEDWFEVDEANATQNDFSKGLVKASFPETGDGSYISPNIGTLLYVPAGSFQRDTSPANISVITRPCRMSEHQITRAQFQTIMGTDPSDPNKSSGLTDPVQMVNWYHAIAFCNKLSLAEGLTPVYSVNGISDWAGLSFGAIPTISNADWNGATADWDADGYRLPTEMEWMWAAMGAPSDGQGGGTNTSGYLKDFAGSDGSNSIDDYAWYNGNSGNMTHPVGTKLPNELGLYDMSGNVFEWCWDWYSDAIPAGTKIDYQGAASSTFRVVRGGSWDSSASSCTVAYRYALTPNFQGNKFGFRVVRP